MKMYIGVTVDFEGDSDLLNEIPKKAHITLAYGEVIPTERMYFDEFYGLLIPMTKIEYWEHVDLTVVRMRPIQPLVNAFNDLKASGAPYEYEFKPHITLCKGNQVEKWKGLLDCTAFLSTPYIKIKE